MPARQAGAAAAAELGNKPDSAALCFRSHQDALDYDAHCVEDANRRLAAESIDAIDRYRNSDVCCYVRLRRCKVATARSEQCDLGFFRVPADTARTHDINNRPVIAGESRIKESFRILDLSRIESAVFLGITELVQSPEAIIPSFVWVERPKQRYYFRRQIVANLPAYNIVIKAGDVVSEREVGSFGIGPPLARAAAYPHWSRTARKLLEASKTMHGRLSGRHLVNLILCNSCLGLDSLSITVDHGFWLTNALI